MNTGPKYKLNGIPIFPPCSWCSAGITSNLLVSNSVQSSQHRLVTYDITKQHWEMLVQKTQLKMNLKRTFITNQ